ncbi:hypothetical protein [Undibacterium sp. Di24W]|uniref:hypothetical protein n=1 Tax=Undibacterium sp. Di24W TaxID=3413033 RepID=UPI003BEFCA0B
MKQKKCKSEVFEIFRNLAGDEFTTGQVLDSYMAASFREHTDSKIARQFIHRTILKLVSSGDLIKTSVEGRRHKYRTTNQFNSRRIELNSAPIIPNINDSTRKVSIKESLTERLHHQKLQLLTALGEAEEYDAIYKEMPEMQKQIQALYNESRDECSKLLGKVKAIENLILLSAK